MSFLTASSLVLLEASKDSDSKAPAYLIIVGLMLALHGYRAFKTRRKVEDTARSKIASAPQGFVEVEGQAWPTIALRSVDGRAVCYWSFIVEEEQGSGKNRRWVQVFCHESKNDFLVSDLTGACRVTPAGAQLEVTERTFAPSKLGEIGYKIIDTQIPAALAHLQLTTGFGGLFSSKVRITEKRILGGAPVYLHGEFFSARTQFEVMAVGEYAGFHQQLEKYNSVSYQRSMFDRNTDGVVCEEEMRNGYSHAANSFLHAPKAEPIRICGFFQAGKNHPLVIADVHQEHLLKRLGKHVLLKLWGGLIMFGIGLWLLAST